ncbi:MAG: TfoX/Sxy family protein [Caldilineales bacterium]|nr:TfoX/Sxy family protein [Caldilineales bacterium]
MAYDETLVWRVREALAGQDSVEEKKMFGGITFMVRGHMTVGVSKEALMVRVGPDQNDEALAQPYARPMEFTGRSMNGFVFVDPPGLESDEDLAAWVQRGLTFTSTLASK